jgi:hypothetical protein
LSPELLYLVGRFDVPDQAMEEEGLALGTPHTGTGTLALCCTQDVHKEHLHGQKWVNLRYDVIRKNNFKSCINKLPSLKCKISETVRRILTFKL